MSGDKVVEQVKESLVRVACCQIEPRVGCKDENVEKTLRFVEEAVKKGAQIIVLPELANTGYVFETRREAFALSEPIPEGPTTKVWEESAREHGIYIAAGITEIEEKSLYNTEVLLGPEGYVGKYRKLHLWNREKFFFEPGDLGLPVFNTEVGRLALMVCYDLWFPEVARIYAVQGADLILNSTNWVAGREVQPDRDKITPAVCVAQSNMNAVFIAAADRIGIERDQPFLGHSLITDPRGLILAGPASRDQEEIIVADCNLVDARKAKSRSRLNHIMTDRRTDIYDILLGYEAVPFSW